MIPDLQCEATGDNTNPSFAGEVYHTGKWPQPPVVVNFAGKRVGIVGTGSSGVQSIPVIAKQALHLTVFQRTPTYTFPARQEPLDPEYVKQIKTKYSEIRTQQKHTGERSLHFHAHISSISH
jgi:cation diffusion facilitator CzcD-associated flavoprotein CzcO